MSGSKPDALVSTASTGIFAMVSPGSYLAFKARYVFSLAWIACLVARSLGPRLANVDAEALYAGTVPDGRDWK
jgi:hypothetical protein